MKKSVLLVVLLFLGNITFAQTGKIVKLLHQQFAKEQKMYDQEDPDKPEMIQPFQIKNDSLTVEFRYLINEKDEYARHFSRAVHLKDITGFIKDMNVLFTAKDGSVKEIMTKKDKNGNTIQTKTTHSHLFFTELHKDAKNNSLQTKMQKAFKKAGYIITSEYWYD